MGTMILSSWDFFLLILRTVSLVVCYFLIEFLCKFDASFLTKYRGHFETFFLRFGDLSDFFIR